MKKQPAKHTCKECGGLFTKFSSLQKYCSYNCAAKNEKTPQKPRKQILPNYKSQLQRLSDKRYEVSRLTLLEEMKERNGGYFNCQRCGRSSLQPMEVHHIVYRSEAPYHKQLHDHKNLVHVCHECHEYFHAAKENRNKLIEERKLYEIFKNINYEN